MLESGIVVSIHRLWLTLLGRGLSFDEGPHHSPRLSEESKESCEKGSIAFCGCTGLRPIWSCDVRSDDDWDFHRLYRVGFEDRIVEKL
jgi:hypothetical protein